MDENNRLNEHYIHYFYDENKGYDEILDFTKLFKAKNINDNIYEIDQKINEILNENIT
jgi:inactivated superfamily I helicase